MWWLIVEALLAGALFVFIIWWTMFAGRRKGEHAEPPGGEGDGRP